MSALKFCPKKIFLNPNTDWEWLAELYSWIRNEGSILKMSQSMHELKYKKTGFSTFILLSTNVVWRQPSQEKEFIMQYHNRVYTRNPQGKQQNALSIPFIQFSSCSLLSQLKGNRKYSCYIVEFSLPGSLIVCKSKEISLQSLCNEISPVFLQKVKFAHFSDNKKWVKIS